MVLEVNAMTTAKASKAAAAAAEGGVERGAAMLTETHKDPCKGKVSFPGAPNSPKQVIFTHFRPQSKYYSYTWSPRDWVAVRWVFRVGIGRFYEPDVHPQSPMWLN